MRSARSSAPITGTIRGTSTSRAFCFWHTHGRRLSIISRRALPGTPWSIGFREWNSGRIGWWLILSCWSLATRSPNAGRRWFFLHALLRSHGCLFTSLFFRTACICINGSRIVHPVAKSRGPDSVLSARKALFLSSTPRCRVLYFPYGRATEQASRGDHRPVHRNGASCREQEAS